MVQPCRANMERPSNGATGACFCGQVTVFQFRISTRVSSSIQGLCYITSTRPASYSSIRPCYRLRYPYVRPILQKPDFSSPSLPPNNRREDQAKVRRAIINRRVDPADIPESARLPTANQTDSVAAPAPSQKKRKAVQEAAAGSSSQAVGPRMSQPSASSQPLCRLSQPAARQEMEEEEEDEANSYEEDELYCVLNSKIVGVQYYKG